MAANAGTGPVDPSGGTDRHVEPSERTRHAALLFEGIAPQYGWVGALLSFGQDIRWRRATVAAVRPRGRLTLDVASGTGLVARELARRGARVVQVDPSLPMLTSGLARTRARGLDRRIRAVGGRAEQLPFVDAAFDALTVTYLLRYVDDPAATVRELMRVVRPGGTIASMEFHVPPRRWARTLWRVYTRRVMPSVGRLVSPAWSHTGRFLGPSIDGFYRDHPLTEQVEWWLAAGLEGVHVRTMSNGAGVVIAGTRR
jgi:demethylmenaquinone methyltransferase/2-methoxy-6-polyprenyl-1,4-benzoquinol methylase